MPAKQEGGDGAAPFTLSPEPKQPCLYCSGTAFEPLYADVQDRLGHVPGRWSFWRCVGCRSALLSPFPRAEDLVAYYPALYSFTPEMGGKSRLRRWLAGLEHRLPPLSPPSRGRP